MSKPVTSWLKKKTRTRKSLGRGSRWQKGTLAGIQNRDAQTSDFLVPGQGSPWTGAAGRTPGCLSRVALQYVAVCGTTRQLLDTRPPPPVKTSISSTHIGKWVGSVSRLLQLEFAIVSDCLNSVYKSILRSQSIVKIIKSVQSKIS